MEEDTKNTIKQEETKQPTTKQSGYFDEEAYLSDDDAMKFDEWYDLND